MAGAEQAVSLATKLGEIGFPEFTTKLINDVFDAIVAANLTQTEAYINLVKEIAKPLTEFINDTKDDISGEMIMQMLTKLVPDSNDSSKSIVRDDNTQKLTTDQATTLNSALKINDTDPPVANETDTIKQQYSAILDAVAKRIAADKYSLLKEMVKLGILRVVVEHGTIETRLTFNTYGYSEFTSNAQSYNRQDFNAQASARTGSFLSRWVNASASTSYTSVGVQTTNQSNRDVVGSQVQIYGRVEINFKTDYMPLNS